MCSSRYRYYLLSLGILSLTTLFHAADLNEKPVHVWPQFLGPNGLADAGKQDIPLSFGANENLLWRVDLPKGNSSPVIWGKYLFVTGFKGQDRIMLAIDRFSGEILWERNAPAPGAEDFTHRLASPAQSTPCTDGKQVYFYFGNYGLIALNFDGSLVWEKRLPKPRTGMGTGTSPILSGQLIILNRDGTANPCILALDTATGEEVWKLPRFGYNSSHATPFLWKNKLRTELIIAGTRSLISINPTTSELIWIVENTNAFPCTSPTGTKDQLFFASWSANNTGGRQKLEAHFDDELVFSDEELEDPNLFFSRFDKDGDGILKEEELPQSRAKDVFKWLDRNKNKLWEKDEFSILTKPGGRGRNIMVTIKPGGKDILNGTEFISWEWKKNLPYVSSPLVSENRVFLVKSLGIVTCLNSRTGEPYFEGKRTGIKGEYFSSPIKAGNKILITSSLGSIIILEDNEEFRILAQNDIYEEIIATPAIVDHTIYLRSTDSLWAFKDRSF